MGQAFQSGAKTVNWDFRGDWIAQFYRLPDERPAGDPEQPVMLEQVLTLRKRAEYPELWRLEATDHRPTRLAGIVSCSASEEDIAVLLQMKFLPTTRVYFVALLLHFDRCLIQKLHGAGVRSFLTRSAGDEDILNAVLNPLSIGTYFSDELMHEWINDQAFDSTLQKSFSLTDREVEVLGLLIKGQSNKIIARELDISVRTIEAHRLNIRRKIGASSPDEFTTISQAILKEKALA